MLLGNVRSALLTDNHMDNDLDSFTRVYQAITSFILLYLCCEAFVVIEFLSNLHISLDDRWDERPQCGCASLRKVLSVLEKPQSDVSRIIILDCRYLFTRVSNFSMTSRLDCAERSKVDPHSVHAMTWNPYMFTILSCISSTRRSNSKEALFI